MYQKKKNKIWIWIVLILLVCVGICGYFYYKNVVTAAASEQEEEIVLEDGQEWRYMLIDQILGNEMTVTVLEEDGSSTEEAQTWVIPVGTDVVTKLGTTTTFARLASGDTLKVLMQNDGTTEDILKIWITDLTSQSSSDATTDGADMQNGEGQMEMPTDGEMPSGGDMPTMPSGSSGDMPDMSSFGGGAMPGGGQ